MSGQLFWKNSIGGVYMIRNVRNGKVLIGFTHNIEMHKKTTYNALMRGDFWNKELQNDFNHNMRFFYHVLHCEVQNKRSYTYEEKKNLMNIAEKYIRVYDAIRSGYNYSKHEKSPECCNTQGKE